MRKTLLAALLILPLSIGAAQASERLLDGALGGAAGGIVFGPVGLVAGAVVGAIMALGNRGPFSLDNVDKAMKFLESGLQLD